MNRWFICRGSRCCRFLFISTITISVVMTQKPVLMPSLIDWLTDWLTCSLCSSSSSPSTLLKCSLPTLCAVAFYKKLIYYRIDFNRKWNIENRNGASSSFSFSLIYWFEKALLRWVIYANLFLRENKTITVFKLLPV